MRWTLDSEEAVNAILESKFLIYFAAGFSRRNHLQGFSPRKRIHLEQSRIFDILILQTNEQ
jgi:hypothetical protein